jgi:hypothetical protein
MWSLLALERGMFKNIESLEAEVRARAAPWQLALPEAQGAEQPEAAQAAEQPEAAPEITAPSRHRGAKTLRHTVVTCSSRLNHALCRMMVELTNPLREAHSALVTLQKTRRGTEDDMGWA